MPLILALLLLAGCATDRIEVDPEVVAAHELVGFDWCSPEQIHQCALIRQGNDMFQLEPGMAIGSGGDIWTTRGATVQAVGGE